MGPDSELRIGRVSYQEARKIAIRKLEHGKQIVFYEESPNRHYIFVLEEIIDKAGGSLVAETMISDLFQASEKVDPNNTWYTSGTFSLGDKRVHEYNICFHDESHRQLSETEDIFLLGIIRLQALQQAQLISRSELSESQGFD